jgi:hypothetical protein
VDGGAGKGLYALDAAKVSPGCWGQLCHTNLSVDQRCGRGGRSHRSAGFSDRISIGHSWGSTFAAIRGGLVEGEKWKKLWKEQKKLLTGIGLLMEGTWPAQAYLIPGE